MSSSQQCCLILKKVWRTFQTDTAGVDMSSVAIQAQVSMPDVELSVWKDGPIIVEQFP